MIAPRQLLIAAALLAAAGCAKASVTRSTVDALLVGGTVFDGSGKAGVRADVATRDGRIVAVGPNVQQQFRATSHLDVTGLAVAPGFIDPHTHALAEFDQLTAPQPLLHYLTQGVTTLVIGNDGGGAANVGERLARIDALDVRPNVALFVGHNAVRKLVMGQDDRAPSPSELAQMARAVERGMSEGALGLSAGLYYPPGVYAETPEVLSSGVRHLMINGAFALRDGAPTGQHSGRGLARGNCSNSTTKGTP